MPVTMDEPGPPEGIGVVLEADEVPSRVAPPITGPESSTAPPLDQEPQAAGAAGAEEVVEEELPEFDPQWRTEFEGLLFIGKLTDTFEWLGHTFVIKTMTVNEMLETALLTKKYQGTLGDAKAYQAAICAACLVEVDGRPIAVPLTREVDDTLLAAKFRYIVEMWYPYTLDVVYEKFLKLDGTVLAVVQAMRRSVGNSPGQTELTPIS